MKTHKNEHITDKASKNTEIIDTLELEEKIKILTSDLSRVQKMAKIGFWKLDVVRDILTWSDETYNIFGLDKKNHPIALLKDFYNVVHPSDLENVKQAYEQHIKTQVPYVRVHKLLTPDNTLKYVEERCETIFDENGKALFSNGTVQDITEKTLHEIRLQKYADNLEKSEEALSNQHKLLQHIVDSVPVRMFWKDKDGVFLGVNQLVVNDAGLSKASDIIGKTDFDMPWKETAQHYVDDDKLIMKNAIPKLNYEETQSKEDGTFIYLLTSKVPLVDINNNIIGILGIYDDITEQKNLQRKAEEKENYMLQQSRMAQMGEMISLIAHQWKQPLSAISIATGILNLNVAMDKYSKESFQEELDSISELTQYLSSTIDDFKDFYKQDKKLIHTTTETSMKKALKIIQASLNNVEIEMINKNDSAHTVEVCENELMQVILNILNNAQDNFKVKGIENPKIKVILTDKSITICDNGGGISEDIIEKIFDPHFSTKDEVKSSGLGLYMSKIIIEGHHNGKLTAVNGEDGVCFTIEL